MNKTDEGTQDLSRATPPTPIEVGDNLDTILHKLWLVFYENSTLTSMSDTYFIAETEAKAQLTSLINQTVSKELEDLKQFKGSYIGIDGKRVDNIIHHAIIDNRIEFYRGKSNE